MKHAFHVLALFAAAWVALVAPGSAEGFDSDPAAASQADDRVMVVRGVDTSRPDVDESWRRAGERGLGDAAEAEGIVVCAEAMPDSPCSPLALAAAPELRWSLAPSVKVANALALVRMPVTLELAEGNGTGSDVGLFVLEETLVLPADGESPDAETLLTSRAAARLAEHAPIRRWLAAARAAADELILVPTVPQAEGIQAAPSASDREVPDARQAAALALVAEAAASPAPEDVERAEEPARQPAEEPAPPPAPEPFDYTFRVRVAPLGEGLLRGVDGRLRISDGGVRFVPGAEDAEGWALSWRQIERWGKAEGLWNARHPLVVIPRDGAERYFVELDQDGHFTSGARILSILSRGAERAGASR